MSFQPGSNLLARGSGVIWDPYERATGLYTRSFHHGSFRCTFEVYDTTAISGI